MGRGGAGRDWNGNRSRNATKEVPSNRFGPAPRGGARGARRERTDQEGRVRKGWGGRKGQGAMEKETCIGKMKTEAGSWRSQQGQANETSELRKPKVSE